MAPQIDLMLGNFWTNLLYVNNFIKQNLGQYYLITLHPETNSYLDIFDQTKSFFSFLESTESPCIITASNTDPGGDYINQQLKGIAKKRDNVIFCDNLGQEGYVYTIRNCKVVIGNSSSALIEVPACNKYTINIQISN